ncbi:hypothetical protein N7495_007895 [Penicillium taxi]|uniref:uncharacterized protein n=1 Tax=Penicillium taxi TaxID=168475 RepID=UPI002545B551|nr:uncharacterized protein N7495_007895 [Penicillium taxi]KAJ5887854.1 hypothetical protein N7495_007895 [Penicillium taxi]
MAVHGKGPVLIGVLWLEIFLCLIVLGLRLYTRTVLRKIAGIDDLLLIITWFLMVIFVSLCTASATYGMGVHAWYLTESQKAHGMLLLLCGQSVISMAMGLSKSAVSLFLLRIVIQRWQRIFLWFWIITIMFLSIFLSITVFAQCTPTRSIWDPRVQSNGCVLNLTNIATVLCVWSALMDFVLAIFPWVALWKINMKPKEKISICTSLSLGIFAGICGIIRTSSLYVLSESDDYLYATTDSVMWTNSELTTTIICISIPALRPLFRSIRGMKSNEDASNYNNMDQSFKSAPGGRSGYVMGSMARVITGKDLEQQDDMFDEESGDADTNHILQDNRHQSQLITKMTELTVSYENRSTRGSEISPSDEFEPVSTRQNI